MLSVQKSFLAVPWQLYRFPCHSLTHWLTHWLTHSLPLLKNTTKEHSERLVTLETCYQSDIVMSLCHWQRDMTRNFSDFWKLFRFSETFQIFKNFSDFRKLFRFLENFQIFRTISEFVWNFQIFGKCLDFWKISDFRIFFIFQIFKIFRIFLDF